MTNTRKSRSFVQSAFPLGSFGSSSARNRRKRDILRETRGETNSQRVHGRVRIFETLPVDRADFRNVPTASKFRVSAIFAAPTLSVCVIRARRWPVHRRFPAAPAPGVRIRHGRKEDGRRKVWRVTFWLSPFPVIKGLDATVNEGPEHDAYFFSSARHP